MIEIRRLSSLPEFTEALHLQQEIWGFADIELLPVRLFVVANKVGGHLFGAYDADRMVAFLIAIPGLKEAARGYLHSHMMGVLPEYRNQGLGRKLKLAQRDDAIARQIPLIEWTFDPLELKNAYLNIEKLGAIMRRYLINNYGTTSSHLHGGLPTDRLVAEWWVAEPRVATPPIEARVAIPANIAELRSADPAAARAIQLRASEQFTEYFGKGLAVVGFERSDAAGTYLLAPWPSQ
jgi:predicted GNAT superfamily acetyltransferase